ncbi:EAL domain-containing protein [Marinobacter sp. HL-58]|uniref:putative bifunctional diguanylate cyclase/phosphodiesterase n=1 Tax=Marinobacter sp. HL-58 TaxID=1479237 RepID=UPI0004890BCA|nr:EAL domain-containing protein [Marinobacter sp. HL-58]KPQ02906.1 MAG: PAS domain S-box/diguanylate cyclase (GGDEF) domain [Marinobacter sp. HL-58]
MRATKEQDFKALVDNHPQAIMLATREPRITYVNRMFHAVTGYREQEVLGAPPSILSSGLHSPDFYQEMWKCLEERREWEGVIWNRRKNGETYPQWLSIYPVRHDETELYAGVFMDIGDVAAGDERLASLAYYDPLTELPNRTLFQEFLQARVAQRATRDTCLAVIFIDLDFFKGVNDLHGHETGDRLLQQAALCIQSVLGKDDVVARLSGDEFAAIVELERREALEDVCERLIAAFRSPVIVGHREFFLSASLGVAVYPGHGRTSVELLQNADRAMHSAKRAGRACYRTYSAVDSELGIHEQRMSEALITSLKTAPEEFSVVYQPQYELGSGQVTGMEVLLRWQHPDYGPISPGEFVPMAEQRGYIHELTEQLVRCILQDLAVMPDRLRAGLRLALNISARQIADFRLDKLLEPLFQRLDDLDWMPELEITETHLMNLSKGLLQRLEYFGNRGVRIAIDDFGTGYSSLAYLHTLPVHVLKIDRQFIKSLENRGHDSRIVSAVLGIAEALQLEVVAEGIETGNQCSALRQMGCHRGQGYWLARPEPWSKVINQFVD